MEKKSGACFMGIVRRWPASMANTEPFFSMAFEIAGGWQNRQVGSAD